MLLAVSCQNSSEPSGGTLRVTPNPVYLGAGDSVVLTVQVLDAHGQVIPGAHVTFAPANASLISVSETGVIQSLGFTGSTAVHVVAGGLSDDIPVTVVVRPSALMLTPGDTTLRAAQAVQYSAILLDGNGEVIPGVPVSWRSTDTAIATVSATGLVTTRGPAGGVYIVASFGSLVRAAHVRVATPGIAETVALSPEDTTISGGASVQLEATLRDAFGDSVGGLGAVTWQSSNPSIATVSNTGFVHATGPTGTTTILASNGSFSGQATVHVLDSLLIGRTELCCRPQAAAIFGNVAYVSQLDANLVSRIDLPSHRFSSSAPVGNIPTGIGFNSTGSRVYVANEYSDNVTVINAATGMAIDAIPATSQPFQVLVAPGDSLIYVSGISTVVGIRLSTKAIIASFSIPEAGNGIAIARDSLLYVSSHTGGTVVEFNLRTRTVSRTFTVGGDAQHLAISPNGNELWIANGAGYVQFWNIDTGLQIGSNLLLPAAGYGIAYRSSNGLLYATSHYDGGGYIYVIDPVARTLLHASVVGGATRDVAFTADGSIGIVANEGGWVDFLR
jgi:YVTN family beta-propeller protein